MESALCRVNAQVASFTFSDGTQESIDKDTLQKSSMLQSLLSEEVQGSADEQRLTFLGAPQCGYLRSWIQLSRLLTQPEESLEAVSCETIVKFLQAADFFCDKSAIRKLTASFASRLFSRQHDTESGPSLQALGQLPDDLVVAVLRTSLEKHFATLDEQVAQLLPSSHALAIRAALPAAASTTKHDFNCSNHAAATSSACLACLSQLPLQELSIQLQACSAHGKRGTWKLHQALKSALGSAQSNGIAVSLRVHMSCPLSLKALLRSAAGSTALSELEITDARYTPFNTDLLEGALSKHLRALTSLQSLTLKEFPFERHGWSPSLRSMRRGLETLTQLTHLYLDRCIRGGLLANLLPKLCQLQSLNACFSAYSSPEAQSMHDAVSGLSQLTSLTLAESRWAFVRKLLYCQRWQPQAHEITDSYHLELSRAAQSFRSNRQVEAVFLHLATALAVIGSAPLPIHTHAHSTMRVLDLSQCCLTDQMLENLAPNIASLPQLQELMFAVCSPGEQTLTLLDNLGRSTCLTRLELAADRSPQITTPFEQCLSQLTLLRCLGLWSCTTRESHHSRPPLLTTLTALTSLTLDKCTPAAVTDADFLAGLGVFTALQTLSLNQVPIPNVWAAEAFAGACFCMPGLESLRLFEAEVPSADSSISTGAICSGLDSLHNLTHLTLDCVFRSEADELLVHVPPDGLHGLCPALHGMSRLKELHLSRMALDETCCSALGRAVSSPALKRLEQLHVHLCTFEQGAYRAFVQGLDSEHCASDIPEHEMQQRAVCHEGVTELVWRYNILDEDDEHILGSIIERFPNITHCKLDGMFMATCRRFKAIQGGLSRLQRLQHLDMGMDGSWDAEGMIAVCNLVGSSRSLRNVVAEPFPAFGPLVHHSALLMIAREVGMVKAVSRVTCEDDDPFKCVRLRDFAKRLKLAVRIKVCGMLVLAAGSGAMWIKGRQVRREKEERRQLWRQPGQHNRKSEKDVVLEHLGQDLRRLRDSCRWNGIVLRSGRGWDASNAIAFRQFDR